MTRAAAGLIVSLLSLASLSLGQNIGCGVSGRCEGIYTDITFEDSANDCITLCQSRTGCIYWTYYNDAKYCRLHASCSTVNAGGCDDCVSGDEECPLIQCDLEGQCQGIFAGFDSVGSRDQCVQACKNNAECAWWSYDSTTRFCTMTKDCPNQDTSCSSCTYGQKSCEVNVAPEPEPDLTLVLISGGIDGSGRHSDGELIDISGNGLECNATEDLPYAIEEHVGFRLNGTAYVCGGYGVDQSDPGATIVYDKCFKFDRTNRSWVDGPTMDIGRARAKVIVWDDDVVWITGGRDKDRVILDSIAVLQGDTFVTTNETILPAAMEFHCALGLSSSEALFAGGYNYLSSHSREAWLYNRGNNSFSALKLMSEGRYGHVCEMVSSPARGGEVIVAGGGYNRQAVEVLDLNTFNWRSGNELPQSTAWAQSVPYQDTSFLMLGGGNGVGTYYDEIFAYNVENQTWYDPGLALHHGKYDFAAVLMDTADVDCVVSA